MGTYVRAISGENEAFCVKWGPIQQFGPHEDQVLNWGPFCNHCTLQLWRWKDLDNVVMAPVMLSVTTKDLPKNISLYQSTPRNWTSLLWVISDDLKKWSDFTYHDETWKVPSWFNSTVSTLSDPTGKGGALRGGSKSSADWLETESKARGTGPVIWPRSSYNKIRSCSFFFTKSRNRMVQKPDSAQSELKHL